MKLVKDEGVKPKKVSNRAFRVEGGGKGQYPTDKSAHARTLPVLKPPDRAGGPDLHNIATGFSISGCGREKGKLGWSHGRNTRFVIYGEEEKEIEGNAPGDGKSSQ